MRGICMDFEQLDHPGQRQYVGVLHLHVEQVNLVRYDYPVGNALFGYNDAVVQREGVHDRCSHTPAGRDPRHNDGVRALEGQHAGKVGAKECTRLASGKAKVRAENRGLPARFIAICTTR